MMMQTEQTNPNTRQIDRMTTEEMVAAINQEDRGVADAVAEALPAIAQAVNAIAARLAAGGRLFYIGAGTSGRLGIIDAVECIPTFGTPPELVQGIIAGGEPAFIRSVEGVEDDAEAGRQALIGSDLLPGDVVVGIAASGRTPYVLGAHAYASEVGALTVGISCNRPAPVLEAAAIAIGVVTGPEVIAGSTRLKAGTAQKLILNTLSTATMIRLGKVYGNLMVDVQVKNEKLLHRARGIVAQIGGVDEDEAARLVEAAAGSAKTAIVMARRAVGADEARALLRAAGGVLRGVID